MAVSSLIFALRLIAPMPSELTTAVSSAHQKSGPRAPPPIR